MKLPFRTLQKLAMKIDPGRWKATQSAQLLALSHGDASGLTLSNRSCRKRVLVSAYACEPEQPSEPHIGWNVVMGLAERHDVWVLVRECHRRGVEAYVNRNGITNPRFVFYSGWRKDHGFRPGLHVQFHYYFWQIGVYFIARALHRRLNFDIVHHITYVRYWTPSFLSLLPAPFIWGPVGGGESAPRTLERTLSPRGRASELVRRLVRRAAEYDPFVQTTARRSIIAIATTAETATRMQGIGARTVETFPAARLTLSEMAAFAAVPDPPIRAPLRFVSIGRLLNWKGIHLGLRAFQRAAIPGSEYWVIGDGPERNRLERLAQELGIRGRVRFWGTLPRETVISQLGESHVLVHPSLHDSGGFVCLEAMAARRPVICLRLGGPGVFIDEHSGYAIQPEEFDQTIDGLAAAMVQLSSNRERRIGMGRAASERVRAHFTYSSLLARIDALYCQYSAQ